MIIRGRCSLHEKGGKEQADGTRQTIDVAEHKHARPACSAVSGGMDKPQKTGAMPRVAGLRAPRQ